MKATEEQIQSVMDCFWETVPPTWNRIRGRVRANAVENFDITLEQFHILRHIRKGSASVSELAEAKQISRPAISQAVETLVSKGLVARKHSSGDRRYVDLELTEKGSELLNAIFRLNRQWMGEKLRSLSAEDLEAISRGMQLMNDAFCEPEKI